MSNVQCKRPRHGGPEEDKEKGEQMRIWMKTEREEAAARLRKRNESSSGGEVRRK